MVLFKIILIAFVLTVQGHDVPKLDNLKIFESQVNQSIECVRATLKTGLPDLGLPSFDPLIIDNLDINMDYFHLDNVSGKVYLNGTANNIVDFVMDKIKTRFKLIPPIFDIDFGLHYDQVGALGDYKINVTINDKHIWGEGYIVSVVENLRVAGNLKAKVTKDSVVIEELKAPITIDDYNFTITGLFGDEEYSRELSEKISKLTPDYINNHPEIFTDYIAPILIELYNALVNYDVGVGIIKEMTQKCITDVIFPPQL